ncbi:hypothetical protein ANN_24498 [Periplaneta americana]|uniref:Uncharacterized protein n=1 Tax=Periplaneta americana TaxID=6978 RepID=A0ABQ8S3K3_PERAM|nr:hypothetical protein ANN_24498 [Periplaneta americana]
MAGLCEGGNEPANSLKAIWLERLRSVSDLLPETSDYSTLQNRVQLASLWHVGAMRPEDMARAVALYDDGRSVRYIANVMNMARSTTHDAINGIERP